MEHPPFASEKLSTHEKEAIEQVKDALILVLKELREEIEKGSYRCIIGDDASGRIPTLIVGGVLKEIYERRGFKPPIVRFVAGSGGTTPETLPLYQQIARIKSDALKATGDAGKVLVVTEAIATGGGLSGLLTALNQQEWRGDIATVGFASTEEHRLDMQKLHGYRVVSGIKGVPKIYSKSIGGERLPGVWKRRGFDVIARKNITTRQVIVNQVRDYLKKSIVPAIIQAYESEQDVGEKARNVKL